MLKSYQINGQAVETLDRRGVGLEAATALARHANAAQRRLLRKESRAAAQGRLSRKQARLAQIARHEAGTAMTIKGPVEASTELLIV
jgi:predicted Zn-dependent protease